ncbi:MAG: Ppx/GppA family phosphatase [Oceanospirillaceae bacterium]|nr:Ppx/GppA family phosphatase [Oceanospirillaceae bacterium]
MSNSRHLVAVDIGSNSIHLVIAQEQSGFIKIIRTQKQRVFLNQGLDDQNQLSQSTIDAGVACLAHFAHAIADLENVSVRIVATHALRKAENSQQFIKAALRVFPYPIEIISGTCEAELIFQGVAHTQPIKGKALIIDIGGGSCEMVIGQAFNTQLVHSLELGSSDFTQRFFSDGDINAKQVADAQRYACEILKPVADQFRQLGWRSALGTSGSVKAIHLCIQELYQSDSISNKLLKQLKDQLIHWHNYKHIPLKSIDKQRLPMLTAAVCILSACFEMLIIKKIHFSNGALREGVLYGLSDSRPNLDIKQRTINQIGKQHFIDVTTVQRVTQQLQVFSRHLSSHQQPLSKAQWQLLTWAAQLHLVGIAISAKKHQHHGQYIIQHCDMPGFSAQQQLLVSIIIGNHKGKISLPVREDAYPLNDLLQLMQIFRLAIILTKGEPSLNSLISDIHYRQDSLHLCINPSLLQQPPLMKALEDEVSLMAKAGMTLRIATS